MTNDPVANVRVEQRNAPTMYSEPCARFTKSMIPKTRVKPAASKNSNHSQLQPVEQLDEQQRRIHTDLTGRRLN